MNNIEKSIESTRESFEKSFGENNFYNRQTQDKEHINTIMELMNVKPGEKVLDLGTGSGYIAFSIAGAHPDTNITGLDIVAKTLEANRQRANETGLKNIDFVAYDGLHFPFDNESFDVVVTRYSLHHFPDINGTFEEINRVLKTEGRLIVSDPTPNDIDTEGFVDEYMQMKKDGHIKFYSEEDFKKIGAEAGLRFMSNNKSSIRFPKKKKDAADFDNIVARHSKEIVDSYDLKVTDEEIYITEQVNNIRFIKADINKIKNKLVDDVFSLSNVYGIAQTGSIDKVTKLNETDIDIFVLCDKIPTKEERQKVYDKSKENFDNCYMTVCENCDWGTGDVLVNTGVDIMFMYFTIDEMRNYLLEVLAGKHLDKQGGFYPVGRLGSIQLINILCEKNNTFSDIKKIVENYPEDFAQKSFAHNFYNILYDEELQRTLQRKDVLFYHSVLEDAIDHFLQALFALNHTYFPSRKRSRQYIEGFSIKPENCYSRLKQIVVKSVCEDTIAESVSELRELTAELKQLGSGYLS